MLFGKFVVTPGSITAGNTSQVVSAAKSRSYFAFYNTSDTAMQLNFGAAALATHIPVPAGGSWISPPQMAPRDSINVLCATTGKTYCTVSA